MATIILVPLDGSPLAERALPYAAAVARAVEGRLQLVRVCPAVSPVHASSAAVARAAQATRERDRREAANALAATSERLRADGVSADAAVRVGPPADTILAETERSGVELIAMSTHGRGGAGRFLHGSVADEVLRRAALPILVVPPAAGPWPPGGPRRVLVALDGSALAEAALITAERLARPFGAELILLRVVDPPGGAGRYPFVQQELERARRYLDRLRRRLRAGGLVIRTEQRVGPTAATIAATARELDADAVAMGTSGRGGLARLVLGSTAEATLSQATVPLLLLPAAAGAAIAASGSPPWPAQVRG